MYAETDGELHNSSATPWEKIHLPRVRIEGLGEGSGSGHAGNDCGKKAQDTPQALGGGSDGANAVGFRSADAGSHCT